MGVNNEEKIGTLETEAARRRERLLALKKHREKGTDNGNEDGDVKRDEVPSAAVLFRNYRPGTKELEEAILPSAEPTDITALVKEQIENGEKAKNEIEVEIANLAPKKITFDLKRGIQTQLDKLDRRTDKAIAELIRARLKEGKQQDFLIAVNVGARAQQRGGYDSEDD